jgi:hypothetical protein
MIPTNNQHLTTEQLYDLLDRPNVASGTHLHVCATCQQEFAILRSSLDNFRVAATNLAAAEISPLAVRRESSASRFGFRPQAFAATFATVAVLLTVSLTLLRPHHVDSVAPAPTSVTASSPESDAALLDGIQQDLSASVPPSLAPLEITPAPTSPGSHQ